MSPPSREFGEPPESGTSSRWPNGGRGTLLFAGVRFGGLTLLGVFSSVVESTQIAAVFRTRAFCVSRASGTSRYLEELTLRAFTRAGRADDPREPEPLTLDVVRQSPSRAALRAASTATSPRVARNFRPEHALQLGYPTEPETLLANPV